METSEYYGGLYPEPPELNYDNDSEKIRYRYSGENITLATRTESHELVDKNKRYNQIIETLKSGREMTAKEIAIELYKKGILPTSERNFTAPRLTELSKMGIVEPIGKKKCIYTRKMVAVYKLRKEQLA